MSSLYGYKQRNINAVSKEELLKVQKEYYENVGKWFIAQLAEWSKKYNLYVQDYTILRMWVIGSDETHEPYSRSRDEDLDEQFKEALKDFEEITSGLDELGYRSYQGMEYSDEAKFIH